MVDVAEPECLGDVADGLIGNQQQFLGAFDAGVLHVVARCHAGQLLEAPGELRSAHLAVPGHGADVPLPGGISDDVVAAGADGLIRIL